MAEAVAAVGKIVGGVGAYAASRSQRKTLRRQAREEELFGATQELRIRDAARAQIGEQIAGQFGNGFFGGSGSALDSLAESQINAAFDRLTVRADAAGKARALRAQGKQVATAGKFALAEGFLGAASSGVDWADARRGTSTGSARAGGSAGYGDGANMGGGIYRRTVG